MPSDADRIMITGSKIHISHPFDGTDCVAFASILVFTSSFAQKRFDSNLYLE